MITDPGQGEELHPGEIAVRGVAWSGAAPIAGVEVSINDGSWQQARLVGDRRRHSWQWWELLTSLDQPGASSIRARAADLAGRTQPDLPDWNRYGYGNNAVQKLLVQVTPQQRAVDQPHRLLGQLTPVPDDLPDVCIVGVAGRHQVG